MTGPSLAGIWGRKAGAVEGFARYSKAMKRAKLVWNAETLDAFLADPQALVPGNLMTFRGIRDPGSRADLIAFLKAITSAAAERPGKPRPTVPRGRALPDLKALGPRQTVASITYCGDTYRVTTGAGAVLQFWEFNLRFKTDSGDKGPLKGRPVIVGSGMRGDRAAVVFASPAEVSAFIKHKC